MRQLAFLHGFTGSPKTFDSVVAALPADVSVIAPTLLGHCATPVSEADEPGFLAEVKRLAAQLRDGAVVPLHLVGYSLGARLGLWLALLHPELFQSVTLVSVNPGLSSAAERSTRRAADAQWINLLQDQGLSAFLDAWQAQPVFSTQSGLPPELLEQQRTIRGGHLASGLATSLRHTGLSMMPSARGRLAQLEQPTLVLTGSRDEKFTALAESMLPEAPMRLRHHVIANVGHNLLLEAPEQVAEYVWRHILDSERRTAPASAEVVHP